MRIAVAVAANRKAADFDRCFGVVVYDIDDSGSRTSSCDFVPAPRATTVGLVKWLVGLRVQHVIATRIEPQTKDRLTTHQVAVSIESLGGAPGELVRAYLATLARSRPGVAARPTFWHRVSRIWRRAKSPRPAV